MRVICTQTSKKRKQATKLIRISFFFKKKKRIDSEVVKVKVKLNRVLFGKGVHLRKVSAYRGTIHLFSSDREQFKAETSCGGKNSERQGS